MRTIKITITDSDCELLAGETIIVEKNIVAIAFHPITTTIAQHGDEEILSIGVETPLNCDIN
jgi:hypothetical protein